MQYEFMYLDDVIFFPTARSRTGLAMESTDGLNTVINR